MSTAIAYFDQLYQRDQDPWQVQQRWYEQRKRALLLAALPKAHYRHALEPGCGTGELTLALAARCDAVWASDGSADAVHITRGKVSHLRHVQVEQQTWPSAAPWPAGRFDLIVISEWAYYLSREHLQSLVEACRDSLSRDGALVACHWRPDFQERCQPTEAVHAAFGGVAGWHRLVQHEERDFLMTAWSPQPESVAQQEGLT